MKRNLILFLSALLLIGLFEVQTFAKGEAMKERIQKEKVFYNQTYNNVKIAGELYKPENFDVNKKYPAIVVVHPAGGVKEQVAGLYAKKNYQNVALLL